ncbi:nitroreductase [Paenibacillus elgii]|uniref:nitroreductase n=1 Tax=Paenibacillus elgii TaxID=189691 RepID=UPI0013D3B92E|nr:nitroreductase [Paenibacillus elgii]
MLNFSQIFIEGMLLSIFFCIVIVGMLVYNPRLLLNDYPQSIQLSVPPKTSKETKLSKAIGAPFASLLMIAPFISTLYCDEISFMVSFLHPFLVFIIVSLVDLVVLDWLMFCFITPDFLIIPGTKGMKDYKNYQFHFIAFLKGTVVYGVLCIIVAGIRMLI